MATPNKLRRLEERYGNLHSIIPALVNKVGQAEAGRQLGLSASTISNWLKAHGYKQMSTWKKGGGELEKIES